MSPRGEPRISASAPMWFDVDAFESGIAPTLSRSDGPMEAEQAARLRGALMHYRGDLLVGWYDDWVLVKREQLRNLCLRGYCRLMEHHAALGEFEDALVSGRAALAMEPLFESVHQRVMELYAASGQRVSALRQYQRLAALLKAELAAHPAKETRALIDRLLSQA